MSGDLAQILANHRAVVCVGTGGVGKTTLSAALALASAAQGRRTMVMTIDPARQLARALGLTSLGRIGEPVETGGLAPPGLLHAAMLDHKGAWDAFISRHAPNPEVRDTLLDNPFYQKVSTSFAGSTEYMAIEELCRLDESDAYDLIIVDTPPAGRAVDFLRAPERIERLLDPQVAGWLRGRTRRGAVAAVGTAVRFVIGRLEHALGSKTLRQVYAFFLAFDALFSDIAGRTARARSLLLGPQTAFLLVVGPRVQALAGADELVTALRDLGAPLAATVANRVHPLPDGAVTEAAVEEILGALEGDGAAHQWLRQTWADARAVAAQERDRLGAFAATLPAGTTWTEVPELERDAHSLADLAELARRLLAGGSGSSS